jgi:hypothetical protein
MVLHRNIPTNTNNQFCIIHIISKQTNSNHNVLKLHYYDFYNMKNRNSNNQRNSDEQMHILYRVEIWPIKNKTSLRYKNVKVLHNLHESALLYVIPNQLNPVYITNTNLFKIILISSSHIQLCFLNSLLRIELPQKKLVMCSFFLHLCYMSTPLQSNYTKRRA